MCRLALGVDVSALEEVFGVRKTTIVRTRLVPVLQVGATNQEMVFSVVHELKGRLEAGCVPVFSMDGLKHYFYALTAHF